MLTRIVRFADAGCAEDYAKEEYGTKCMAKVTVPTGTDKAEYCKYVQGTFACYPSSCCEDDSMKAAMTTLEDSYKAQGYLDDGCTFEVRRLKCSLPGVCRGLCQGRIWHQVHGEGYGSNRHRQGLSTASTFKTLLHAILRRAARTTV